MRPQHLDIFWANAGISGGFAPLLALGFYIQHERNGANWTIVGQPVTPLVDTMRGLLVGEVPQHACYVGTDSKRNAKARTGTITQATLPCRSFCPDWGSARWSSARWPPTWRSRRR
mgnify:CR=1 FL=1